MITVKACPQCGALYERHCYHDERQVTTVEMPVEEALGLAERSLEAAREETVARLRSKLSA